MPDIPYSDVVDAARAAGEAIMAVYGRDFTIYQKSDNSPVTEADLAAHRLIADALARLTPDIPLLSEESADIPWETRQQWQRYWLVDPLDGTKEFIRKNDEFTVNIALIENDTPTWGVVYAPALGTLYHGGTAANGAYKIHAGKETPIVASAAPQGRDGWRIVGSRSHQSPEFLEFIADFDEPEIKSLGSSLKMCLIAEGEADLYPRLGPTSEWDTGAAHAVLLGAGGEIVVAESAEALRYNQTESVLNPFFIAKGRS